MAQINRTCVVGAGAIGSLFAGHLGTVAESTVLTRRQNHADDLNGKGLRVSGKSDLHSNIIASTDPADLGDVDLVIIATKASFKGADPQTLMAELTAQNPQAKNLHLEPQLVEAITLAKQLAQAIDGRIFVVGGLFLAGEAAALEIGLDLASLYLY